jgi:hypothetical protein
MRVLLFFFLLLLLLKGHLMYYKNVIAGVRTVENWCLILRGGDCFADAKDDKRPP